MRTKALRQIHEFARSDAPVLKQRGTQSFQDKSCRRFLHPCLLQVLPSEKRDSGERSAAVQLHNVVIRQRRIADLPCPFSSL
jgi:hypothetical protein